MMRWLLLCLTVMVLPGAFAEGAEKPLLIDGKTELFQRVLTRPGAEISTADGGRSTPDPFTPFYVYGREVAGSGAAVLRVGIDARGKVLGQIAEVDTVPWEHAMVLAFADRVNRDRALFFRNHNDLRTWSESPRLGDLAATARRDIDADSLPSGSPVVSIEPEAPVDFETNFYMLPILSAEKRRLPSGFRTTDVEIASITKEEQPDTPIIKRRLSPAALQSFRAGVVFLIDASSSMGPYIDQTRQVMDRVLRRVEADGMADRVRFGLVAYRDDPETVQGIEFLTRTFADPNIIDAAEGFASATEPLAASAVSTRAFPEDGFAAIDAAFDDIDWSEFGARFLILVTDASSRTEREEGRGSGVIPASATGLSTASMQQIVRSRKTALYVLHLQTEAGEDDHARAEAQYRDLSRYENVGSLYFPVESGDPKAFAATVETLADALVRQVQDAERAVAKPEVAPAAADAGSELADTAALIGRAMALAHLGRAEGVEAPSMFRAWASDRDLTNPEISSFSVRVLLSKSQLSDLQKTLELTAEALERGQIDPDDLFNQLRSAAIAAGRDPDRIGQGDVRNLEETGLVGEYLDGLPYQSRLMALTEDDWIAMGVSDQQEIIDQLYASIRLYQRFHDDTARWVSLNEGAVPDDYVYPVPIDALP
ncbi:MAG: vWA domain-containing protein [Pseudomonadota bacterium]